MSEKGSRGQDQGTQNSKGKGRAGVFNSCRSWRTRKCTNKGEALRKHHRVGSASSALCPLPLPQALQDFQNPWALGHNLVYIRLRALVYSV